VLAYVDERRFSAQGQSQVPEDIENVTLHFNVLVCIKGRLIELDGRKQGPIDHGETTPEHLLKDAVRVISKFMERDPESIQFSMVALIANT
jgi:ubiquitin carboxyl-terminal hydrolase L3